MPFIGDGDLALKLYVPDGFTIYGADTDGGRLATCHDRLPTEGAHQLAKADCNGWPFPEITQPFTLADFDAYSEPYASFRAFWQEAPKAETLALIFTDGHRQGIIRAGVLHHPSGEKRKLGSLSERRAVFNFYWRKTVRSWFVDYVRPYRILRTKFYTRAGSMLYWGAIITR